MSASTVEDVLARIRERAVEMTAASDWPGAGDLTGAVLPDPLAPMALLPVATGVAAGAEIADLLDVAAAVCLFDVALRIVDDCADGDNPVGLHVGIGIGRAVNYAMALSTIASRRLCGASGDAPRSRALAEHCARAFVHVCRGQDADLSASVDSLSSYQEVVALKTVAAYEFAAAAGARIAPSDEAVVAACSRCGEHLGWMAQVLDDVEALWFPVVDDDPIEKPTYPVLLGLTLDHPAARRLAALCRERPSRRAPICATLDEMDVRTRLMSVALDHRDAALECLAGTPQPAGRDILVHWLDRLLRDAARLVGTPGR